MAASDKHGPTYPGDLVVIHHSVMYRTISFNWPVHMGDMIDHVDDMVGTSEVNQIGMIVASVRGQGTWKYIVVADQVGWVPWMGCDLVQSLPSQP